MTPRATLRLMPSGAVVPEPRRVASECANVHEARCAAVKALGRKWILHPAYSFDPRHSYDANVWQPARAAFLACIAKTAAADRARNPAFRKAEAVRAVIGGNHG